MSLTISTVTPPTNCHWKNAEHTEIGMDVLFDEIGRVIPFSTKSTATDPWAVTLWAQATTGAYGSIAAFSPVAITSAQLISYANAKAASLLQVTKPYNTSVGGGATFKSDATGVTIANLLALAQWGTANPAGTENWVANDGTVQTVTGAQIVDLASRVGTYAQQVYGVGLAAVIASINSGAYTSYAQIDGYSWP